MPKIAKSKLKWVLYTGEMFDVYVTPDQIKRIHAPLEPDLVYVPEMRCKCLHLHPGSAGLDNDGAIVAYLYCTDSGRFFDRGKDGWGEQKYDYYPCHQYNKGRTIRPFMRHFGHLQCHLIVAHAWLGARPEGMVCDHLDTNLLNFNANNLQWVYVPENIRRAKIARRMRKIGLDPKRLTPTLCRGIYTLPEENDWAGIFLSIFIDVCGHDPSPLSTDAIRLDVVKVLDMLKEHINAGKKLPLVATYEQLNKLAL